MILSQGGHWKLQVMEIYIEWLPLLLNKEWPTDQTKLMQGIQKCIIKTIKLLLK